MFVWFIVWRFCCLCLSVDAWWLGFVGSCVLI